MYNNQGCVTYVVAGDSTLCPYFQLQPSLPHMSEVVVSWPCSSPVPVLLIFSAPPLLSCQLRTVDKNFSSGHSNWVCSLMVSLHFPRATLYIRGTTAFPHTWPFRFPFFLLFLCIFVLGTPFPMVHFGLCAAVCHLEGSN